MPGRSADYREATAPRHGNVTRRGCRPLFRLSSGFIVNGAPEAQIIVGNPLLNKRVEFRLGNHIVVVFKAVLPVDMRGGRT